MTDSERTTKRNAVWFLELEACVFRDAFCFAACTDLCRDAVFDEYSENEPKTCAGGVVAKSELKR